ncbi:MAG: restriction endonuclease subunit S [Gammaproteobacteria bacterium]|nr:restriction endonuclease subunit S [Gammaproteobacteria bacterium]
MAVIQNIDITREQHETVRSLLDRHLPNTEAWAYGSRVRWTSRPESDLDVVVFAQPTQARAVGDLREAFSESHLSFRVDLFVWDDVPRSFRCQIESEHVVLVHGKSINVSALRPDWTRLNLGEVCTKIGSGATPRGGKDVYMSHGPYALIRSQNVLNEGFQEDGLAYIGGAHASQLKNVEVAEEDVLLNITGDSVARVCQVRSDVLPARVNQHVAIVRPNPTKLDPCFLRYALVSPEMQTKLRSWAGSGATRNALTKGMIESLCVAAPRDVCVQRDIAQILGTLDDKVELNRSMNQKLEAIGHALFRSWFVDFEPVRAKMEGRDTGLPQDTARLFPDSLGKNGLPRGWQMSTFGEHVLNFDARRVPVSRAQRANMQGRFPYHGAAGVLDHVNDYLFDGTFLLLGEDGSVLDKSGLAVTQYVSGQFWVNNHAHVLQGKGAVSTEQAYLHFAFEPISPFVTGAVQPKLSQRRMNQIPFVYAGEDTCRAFAQAIGASFARLRANVRESVALAAVRDALLPKLISGEIGVSEAERSVEAATNRADA